VLELANKYYCGKLKAKVNMLVPSAIKRIASLPWILCSRKICNILLLLPRTVCNTLFQRYALPFRLGFPFVLRPRPLRRHRSEAKGPGFRQIWNSSNP